MSSSAKTLSEQTVLLMSALGQFKVQYLKTVTAPGPSVDSLGVEWACLDGLYILQPQ